MEQHQFAVEPKLRHGYMRWLAAPAWQVRSRPSGDVSPDAILSRILTSRGLDTPALVDAFFHSTVDDLPDPFLFQDMARATSLILDVMRMDAPKILVFGDYDADGLTAAAIVARWFRGHGVQPDILIPDRIDDGYGLSGALVEEILIRRPDLVVTVDTGTTSSELIALMVSEGTRVVVTDHHLPTVPFDRRVAPLINPSAEDETYPFRGLSGAGTAWMLTVALDRAIGGPSPDRDLLTVLAAVGTIADVMPMRGVNRVLVRHGLERFEGDAPAGLVALSSRMRKKHSDRVSSSDVAFFIAPRLNAAGRMGDVRIALDLLLEDDAERAGFLALKLETLNEERRRVEREVFDAALKQVTRAWGDTAPVVAIARGVDWHRGVLGIVSSRLVDRLHVPAFTLREEAGVLEGSARTYGSIDLIRSLDAVRDTLDRYGGHRGAAGLQLPVDRFDDFCRGMTAYMRSLPEAAREERIEADIEIPASAITGDLMDRLDLLEPTGQDFGRAVFLLRRLVAEEVRRVGGGHHLKMRLRAGDGPEEVFDAIFFRGGEEAFLYEPGDVVDVLATPEWNVWQGGKSINLHLKAIRPSDVEENDARAFDALTRFLNDPQTADLSAWGRVTPSLFKALWRFLEQLGADGDGRLVFSLSRLAWILSHRYNIETDAFPVLAALRVFSDVDLCRLEKTEAGLVVFTPEKQGSGRPSLASSPLWASLSRHGWLREKSSTRNVQEGHGSTAVKKI